MEKLKKFFGDSKGLKNNFYINFVVITVVTFLLPIFLNKGFDKSMIDTKLILTIFFLALFVGLFMAFKKHESNIQKSLISAIYILFIVNQIYEMKNFLNAIIFIIIYIIHLRIMADKKGDEFNLKLYYVFVFAGLIFEVTRAIIIKEAPGLLTSIPSILLLISIDTKIYLYKEERAKHMLSGTWNMENKEKAKAIFDI